MADEKPFKCVEITGRGRALVTTRAVRGGETVLTDSPSLLYVDSGCAQRFCGTCLRICSDPDSAECVGCGVLKFCSSECSASFPKDLCAALGQLKEAEFDSETENQARFLLAAYHLALVSPKKFEKLLLLEGDGKVDDEGVSKLHSLVEKAVRSWPWKTDEELSPKLTADLLVKESRNGFGLMAPSGKGGERSVRGYGLYTTAAFINHECLPNCCRFDYVDKLGESSTDIHIRAMHNIEPETEITISYFPINWPYEVRQERLEKEYGFNCVCERCNTEVIWSDPESEDKNSVKEEEDEGELQNGTAEEFFLENNVEALRVKTSKMATNPDDDGLEEEVEEGDEGDDEEDDDDDFEHAMFFVKYLCPLEECGGTMAPIPPDADTKQDEQKSDNDEDGDLFLTMECNVCRHVRTGDEFRKDLEDNCILE